MSTDTQLLKFAAPLAVGAAVIALWQVMVVLLELPPYLLPSPARVAQALIEDRGLRFDSLLVTIRITIAAFILAVVLGTAAAFVFAQSRWLEMSLFPYAVLLQVTPVVAIAPLIIIWVKSPDAALTICAENTGSMPMRTSPERLFSICVASALACSEARNTLRAW